ncbi:hypothetical protein GF391_00430 [Candidatus Uhrbacteria bacterium]|nr:hypothetical protein [Candidatus Uhrbacteria bacterium]
MYKKIIYTFFLLAFSVLIFGIATKQALAFAVSPVVIEHELAPGMSATGKIRVTNTQEDSARHYVFAQKFVPVGEEGRQQYIEPEDDITNFSQWFDINNTSYVIDAKSTEEIEYTITVPPNAEPGGHYGALFVSLDPPDLESEESGASLSSNTGILFLIRIAGDIFENATVESFDTNQKIFSHLPANFSLRLRNEGNVHFRPKGTMEIRNMWGSIVARVPANPRNSAVLPNSIRRINTWWAKTNELAQGGFTAGLINEWNNFGLGRYTAAVNVKYGTENKNLEPVETSFWVIPWRMILILAVFLITLFIVMKIYNKAIVSSAIKKSNKKK